MIWSGAATASSSGVSRRRWSICEASSRRVSSRSFSRFVLLEKILQRGLDPFRRVDLPLLQTLAEVLGRQVDVHELVRLAEHRIRYPLADLDVGRLLHHVVEAFQVLDVQRGDDVDPLGQDVLDILVPFGVPAAGDIGVRQFVDEGDLGLPGEDGVEVHLLEDHAPVFLAASRDDVESLDQLRGFRPAVGLHQPDDDVDPLVFQAVPLQEHLVRLPDAGAVPEVYLQPAAPRAADQSEEGVGPRFRHTGYSLPSSARFSAKTFTLGSPSNPRVLPSVCARTSSGGPPPSGSRGPRRPVPPAAPHLQG